MPPSDSYDDSLPDDTGHHHAGPSGHPHDLNHHNHMPLTDHAHDGHHTGGHLGGRLDGHAIDWGIHEGAPGVAGTPVHDALSSRRQTGDFTCAVNAQVGILHCLTGQSVSELQASVEAAMNGWLSPSGTLPSHLGNWLQLHHIPCHSADNASFADIIKELRDGNKVIVGVNADALWHSNETLKAFRDQAADHAIWITAVDTNDPHHVKIVVNDSGRPDGAGNVYDLHEMSDVMNHPGFHYVATGYGQDHGIFHDLDRFLQDHAEALTLGGGAALAAGMLLGLQRHRKRAKQKGSADEMAAPPSSEAMIPKARMPLALPPPSLRLGGMSQEERERLLRDL